jgi:hypothetical protein
LPGVFLLLSSFSYFCVLKNLSWFFLLAKIQNFEYLQKTVHNINYAHFNPF